MMIDCSICLENISGTQFVTCQRGHKLHVHCFQCMNDAKQTLGRPRCPTCRGTFPCMICEEELCQGDASNIICCRCVPQFITEQRARRRVSPKPSSQLLERISTIVHQHAFMGAIWAGISQVFNDWHTVICRNREGCTGERAALAMRIGLFLNVHLNICYACERIIECTLHHTPQDTHWVAGVRKFHAVVQKCAAGTLLVQAIRLGCEVFAQLMV